MHSHCHMGIAEPGQSSDAFCVQPASPAPKMALPQSPEIYILSLPAALNQDQFLSMSRGEIHCTSKYQHENCEACQQGLLPFSILATQHLPL